jgi:photosystem I reaction center subunit XII
MKEFQMIYDSQVYTALCVALLAGILAIRLGSTLYE